MTSRFSLVCATAVVTSACASAHKSTPCEAPAADFQVAAPVFSSCQVDKQAKQLTRLEPIPFDEIPLPPTGFTEACYDAQLDVVIDTNGQPLSSTAKVVRANHQQFTDAVIRHLGEVHFSPAEKDGKRVREVVRFRNQVALKKILVSNSSLPMPRIPRPTC